MHVLVMLVLLALVPEGAEGNSWSMQPRQVLKKPLDWLTADTPTLHNFVKAFFCNYGSRMANKVEQVLQNLKESSLTLQLNELFLRNEQTEYHLNVSINYN